MREEGKDMVSPGISSAVARGWRASPLHAPPRKEGTCSDTAIQASPMYSLSKWVGCRIVSQLDRFDQSRLWRFHVSRVSTIEPTAWPAEAAKGPTARMGSSSTTCAATRRAAIPIT